MENYTSMDQMKCFQYENRGLESNLLFFQFLLFAYVVLAHIIALTAFERYLKKFAIYIIATNGKYS